MADEIKKIITVDVSGAVSSLEEMREETEAAGYGFKSLGEAKKYIDSLKASLIDMDETSTDYAETVEEIDKVHSKMTAAMKATSSTIKDAEGSYNALSKQMSELKKSWKATADEAERDAIGKQIVEINDKLKEFDSSIGNYQRNVGNYASAFTSGFKDMAEGLDNLVPGIKKSNKAFGELGGAMKAFAANPIGAVIALIVTAFFALKKAIESNKQATESIKKAMKAFEPVLNIVSNAIGFLADKIALVVEWLGTKLTGAIEWVVNKGLNKLVNGVINAINFISKPWRTFYSWIIGSIEAIVKAAAKVGEITGLFNINGAVEALDKARVAVRDFEIANVDLGLSFEKLSAKQEEETETTKKGTGAKKEATDAVKDHIKALEMEKNVISERIKAAKKDSDEYFALLKELENKEWEIQEARLKDEGYTDEQIEVYRKNHLARLAAIGPAASAGGDNKEVEKILERTELALLSSTERELAILKKKYEEEKKLLEDNGKDTVNLTKEYQAKVAEVKSKAGEGKIKDIDSETALEAFIADKTIKIESEKQQRLLEIERERLNGERAIYEELFNLDDISAEKKEEYKNKLAEIDAQIIENDEKQHQAKIDHIAQEMQTYSAAAQGLADLMNTVADMMQDNIKQRLESGKINEEQAKKEFENTKKMQIAGAIINGLAGVAMAVSTAMQLGPIVGPIMGAINSALVIATTAAQIAKIKQTQFGGGSSASVSSAVATPSASAASYTPQYSTNVTGQSETTDLANAVKEGQSDMRVYVVESDINEAGKKAEVRESEATF